MPSAVPETEKSGMSKGDVGDESIAAVYAKALMSATEAAGQTDIVLAQLDSFITDVLDKLPRLDSILSSRLISADEKIAILDKAIGQEAARLFVSFLKVLAKNGRLDSLRAVRREARKIVDRIRGRVPVHVTTAVEIDGGLQQQLTIALRGMLGAEPVLQVSTRPDLIGGLVLRIGDTVYDGSIATRLARLREHMIDRSVHEIQSGRDRFSIAEGN